MSLWHCTTLISTVRWAAINCYHSELGKIEVKVVTVYENLISDMMVANEARNVAAAAAACVQSIKTLPELFYNLHGLVVTPYW